MSFSKALISGTILSDPEKRFTANNHAVTSFNISTTNPNFRSEQPIIVKITCWRNMADAAAEQLQKGEEILVEGRLMINSFQTQEGVQKRNFEVEAAGISKLPGRPQSLRVNQSGNDSSAGSGGNSYNSGNNGGGAYASAPAATTGVSQGGAGVGDNSFPSSDEMLTEDDIPF